MITVNSLIIITVALIAGAISGIIGAWYLYKDMGIEKVAPLTTFKKTEEAETIRVRLAKETTCEECCSTGIGVKNTYSRDNIKAGFSVGGEENATEYFCLYHAHDPSVISDIAQAKLDNENYNTKESRFVRNITTDLIHTTQRLCEYAEESNGYDNIEDSPICSAELDDEIIELDSKTRLQFLQLIPKSINDPTSFTQPGDRQNLRKLWALIYTATFDEDNVSTKGTMSSTVEPIPAN